MSNNQSGPADPVQPKQEAESGGGGADVAGPALPKGTDAIKKESSDGPESLPEDPLKKNSGRLAPDHGTSFVPGAGSEDFAPKSLDHFRRGYEERAAQRDKEFYSLHLQQDRHKNRHGGGNNHNNGGGRTNNHHGRHNSGRGGRGNPRNPNDRYMEDHWNHRNRTVVVNGMDVNKIMDRLESFASYPKKDNNASFFAEMDQIRDTYKEALQGGKALTALIAASARQRKMNLAYLFWEWMDHAQLPKNTYHYNSMISVTEKARKFQDALALMREMTAQKVAKNEVTFSSAISACEKCGEWRVAMDLLDQMEAEGIGRTAIAYNAAISACEKGMVPQKACDVFQRMKQEGIRPSVVSYSALISAAEKGSQWKLALEILEEMKADGFPGNVVAYSAAISALAKGQQWEKALNLFREIQAAGGQPSIVTYNATITALEKGMQWERALDLFDEMKRKNMPITVVSYGSAISACDKGLQYRQCLEFLDEMTDIGIQKNVIIFGAAMSCMEKSCRADIAFQLMDRMKLEGIAPNVHIYNSVISACARSNLWEKGYELFAQMDEVNVKRDVVTYNAVLDAVCSQVRLGRTLFEQGVQQGFYARVSRLGEHWFELDLHFLSLGGGEIALGWWFEECLVPYLVNTEKLKSVKSISIVTGYGKTRTRGRRQGDDGMRKRCRAMLDFMNIKEIAQPNAGRIHVDKDALIAEVKRLGGKVKLDLEGYIRWKEMETTANVVPDVEQKIRPRYRPVNPGSGRPPFLRIENESTSEEYKIDAQGRHPQSMNSPSFQPPPPRGDRFGWEEGRGGQRGNYEDVRRDLGGGRRDQYGPPRDGRGAYGGGRGGRARGPPGYGGGRGGRGDPSLGSRSPMDRDHGGDGQRNRDYRGDRYSRDPESEGTNDRYGPRRIEHDDYRSRTDREGDSHDGKYDRRMSDRGGGGQYGHDVNMDQEGMDSRGGGSFDRRGGRRDDSYESHPPARRDNDRYDPPPGRHKGGPPNHREQTDKYDGGRGGGRRFGGRQRNEEFDKRPSSNGNSGHYGPGQGNEGRRGSAGSEGRGYPMDRQEDNRKRGYPEASQATRGYAIEPQKRRRDS